VEEKNRKDDEVVGHRRPPKASQFKKGQSGNPGGRPPKTAGHRSIAARVLGEIRRVSGQPKGARVRYTTLELIVMTLKQLTATGHAAATALYMKCVARHGTQQPSDQPIGYIVVPEALTREEWEARYMPKDDPPGDPNDID
jgi:hypothetical protein